MSIEMTDEEMAAFLKRVEGRCLTDSDYLLIQAMAESIHRIRDVLEEKDTTIARLVRMLFGTKTESSRNILKERNPAAPRKSKEKKKGHGRNGADRYCGAEKKKISRPEISPGTLCPECLKGKLYHTKPGVLLRFVGTAPIQGTVYELEKYRCNLCGEIFTAKEPEEAGDKKYDETVAPSIALLKYGNGLPFYRLEQLQRSYGIPLAASTQWELVEAFAKGLYPVYPVLMDFAAQGCLFHNDDTPAKILAMLKHIGQDPDDPQRKGLFFTGKKHAGENLADLLRRRKAELPPPVQMCNALSRNLPQNFTPLLANCLGHARRNFIDVFSSFPEPCRHVIETLAMVYHYDALAKEKNMNHNERLRFHQEHSAAVMEALKEWLHKQIEDKEVEPNSGLGKAIHYMLKHWEPLTLFLRVPGAPLDNNLVERALKRVILHRKNALFFKTTNGAYVGDLLMSLIHTCHLSVVNPFHYLTTLQRHASELSINPENPERWLPWNYHLAISQAHH